MKVTVLTGRLQRSTAKSVGYDLFSSEDVLLPSQSYAVVGTGVTTEMDGCFALILDRSGLASKYGVSRRAGVIDPDYRGEWMVCIHNEGLEGYQIRKGDKIAQVVLFPLTQIEVVGDGVEQLTVERTGGLGSTGR